MDFNYTAEDEAFRAEFRAWLRNNLQYATPMREPLADEEAGDWEARVRWHRKLNEGGWMAINWPPEYGGRGASILQNIIYHEELQRAGTAAPFTGFGIPLLGPTLIHWGTAEQKRRYLPKILTAEEIWCQGYSEPNAGSDLAGLQTRALEDGDYFVVNGSKIWTSAAQHADWIFLLVRTDPNAPKHKGISYLLVDMKTPGVTVRPLVQMTGARGFNQVFFEDVRVPRQNLVGQQNQGWQVALTTLMFERSTGHDRGIANQISELVDLARQIPLDGRTAWESGNVRQKIAQFLLEAAAIKYTGYRQLTRQLKGLPPGPEGSMLKLCSTELALRLATFAMELLGAYGQLQMAEPLARDAGKWSQRMMAARGATIYAGTNQVQHNIIGERVLGLPKG
ncbi:MAG TPA: acyl-CoA dehydrogenase family protein [Candidatus Sulfotelmatobacter sp.]|nr:acyl-CoA dehydrogenase family protein [Candidatus Sulfotelmatobacter sp.]